MYVSSGRHNCGGGWERIPEHCPGDGQGGESPHSAAKHYGGNGGHMAGGYGSS